MDIYAIGDAAVRGVILLLFFVSMLLAFKLLRWLWRRIMGLSVDGLAQTTGVIAGKADGAARRFADGFKTGFKKAQD